MSDKLPENQLRSRYNGVGTGYNIGKGGIAPARLYMLGKNMGKAAVIKYSTPRKIMSGEEPEYAKTARKVELDCPAVVEEVFFVKDPFNKSEPLYWGAYFVIFKSLEDGHFFMLEMPKFHTQNMDLGFEFHYKNDLMRKLKKGAEFKKGTVFGQSGRITENNEWCPGVEMRVAPMSHPATEEDAIIISESFARKVGVTFRKTIDYQWNENEYIPLNLYGDENIHQPFPLAGEPVREDGIVMAFRRKDVQNALVGLTKKSLMEVDTMYDICYRAEPGSIIADIKVETDRYKNQSNNKKAHKPTRPHTLYLELYEKSYNEFYNDVVNWYKRKKRDLRQNQLLPIDGALWNFIFRSMGGITVDYGYTGTGKYHPIKRKFQHIPLKDWRVVINIRQDLDAKVRFKMTGMQGDKVTIGQIWPDERMPVDDHGERAEAIIGNFPAFKRQVLTSLIELDTNFFNIHIYKEIKGHLNEGKYEAAWNSAITFYQTVSPEFAELMEILDADERIAHLEHISKDENEFSVWFKSDSKRVGIEITKHLLEQYKDIKPTPVTYINDYGDKIRTLQPIPITSVYYIMLDKFGEDISSQSTPKLNIFGLPTSLSKHERSRNFYRAQLNRNVGETEGRLFINQKGGAAAVRALTLANSPEMLEVAIERIMRAPNPFTIQHLVYPGEEQKNHSLQVIANILADYGLILRKEHADDRIA